MRGNSLRWPAGLVWCTGLLTGAAAYPLGYFLVLRKARSLEGVTAFFLDQQTRVSPFRSQQGIVDRLMYFGQSLDSVVDGSWHSAMMFNGVALHVPAGALKLAILVALPLVVWAVAEVRRVATPLQRLVVALPCSFAACSLVFGDRLGGHHYAILVPILYLGLGVSFSTLLPLNRRWSMAASAGSLAILAATSATAQADFGQKLVLTGGKGFLSDAIHRFASELNATEAKPFLWFPDAVMALPLIMLTNGQVEMSDQLDDREPRRRLCSGEDVWLVRIPNHASSPRGDQWLERLDWAPIPKPAVYAERDGTPVFEVVRLRGRPGACDPPA
jgi:hypothetical protein